MDRLYTLITIIMIGMFIYWHQQKQMKINILKSRKKKHALINKKKLKQMKKLEKRENVYKKNTSHSIKNGKKVKFAENVKQQSTDNDEISIDSLESNDYNSLNVELKNDDDSDDEFLDD